MSIDKLHERVRKFKNPSVIDFSIKADALPPHLLQEESSFVNAYGRFCRELMASLRDLVPCVRFSFNTFAMLGADGLQLLPQLLTLAGEYGFYVFLDSPEILSPWDADQTADSIMGDDLYPCDALIVSPYIGSDAIKPFLPYCKEKNKALFAVVRSPNKSASELQDLLSGSRQVHTAAADMINRLGEGLPGKCGFSQIGALASAGSAASLQNLRTKYKYIYLFVDGLDYPSANAKNCSLAFDRYGYGAVVCAGPSVTAAWKETESDGIDYTDAAVQAAERMRRNLTRYVTIL